MNPRPEISTATFWINTAERAVKTAAQVAVAAIGTDAAGITSLDWPQIGAVAATAFVLSVLTSLASDRIGPTPGPALTPAPDLTPPAVPPALPTGGVRNDVGAALLPGNGTPAGGAL